MTDIITLGFESLGFEYMDLIKLGADHKTSRLSQAEIGRR